MWWIAAAGFTALVALAGRGVRWAYVAFVVLGLLYFPVRSGFRFQVPSCETAIDVPLAVFSLTNHAHVVLFAVFFAITISQFPANARADWAWAALITVVMGAMVELAEGVTGRGHCRLRDFVPNAAGAAFGALVTLLWRIRRARRPQTSG